MADAAETTTETTEVTEETTTTTAPAATDDAVEKWKALSRKNEKAAKQALAELEQLRQQSMSEQERAVAEAKAQGRSEATSALQLERVRDKIEAKAAGKLADPEDAAALLGDLNRFVDDDGTVDTSAIAAAVDQLVKSKPYLATQPGNGSGEGGPRGSSSTAALNGDPLQRDLERKLGIR